MLSRIERPLERLYDDEVDDTISEAVDQKMCVNSYFLLGSCMGISLW